MVGIAGSIRLVRLETQMQKVHGLFLNSKRPTTIARMRSGAFVTVITLFTALTVRSSTGRVESMKLLGAGVGWAASTDQLFWTGSYGREWKNITPKTAHKSQLLASVFFLDSNTGWVLINCADGNRKLDDTCFEVASTPDGGENWSIVHPQIVDPDPEAGFSGRAFINFADSLHGWVVLKVARSLAVSFGVMLATDDGGKTWKSLPTPPIAEDFRFVDQHNGWMAGGPGRELYATRDGGQSWRSVSLPAPGVAQIRGADYDLPTVAGSKMFLPVRYEVSDGVISSSSTLALFSSLDLGSSWKLDRTLTGLPDEYGPGVAPPTAVVDSTLLYAYAQGGTLSLQIWRGAGSVSRNQVNLSRVGAVRQLSFASSAQGWLLEDSKLLSTNDGGVSWLDITPGGATLPRSGSRREIRQMFRNRLYATASVSENGWRVAHSCAVCKGGLATNKIGETRGGTWGPVPVFPVPVFPN